MFWRFLRALFSRRESSPRSRPAITITVSSSDDIIRVASDLPGDGTFPLSIVGESHYQEALEAICGGRDEGGADLVVSARLVLENSNPYDPNAVRVEIKNRLVGYLARNDAKAYREYLQRHGRDVAKGICPAQIRGGWDRGPQDRGSFGVRLDFTLYG